MNSLQALRRLLPRSRGEFSFQYPFGGQNFTVVYAPLADNSCCVIDMYSTLTFLEFDPSNIFVKSAGTSPRLVLLGDILAHLAKEDYLARIENNS